MSVKHPIQSAKQPFSYLKCFDLQFVEFGEFQNVLFAGSRLLSNLGHDQSVQVPPRYSNSFRCMIQYTVNFTNITNMTV